MMEQDMQQILFTQDQVAARVQELAHRFQSAHGSYLCRDLLAGVETMPGGAPEARTAQYYAKRPCAGLCESAAALFDAYVQENPPENA